MIARPQKIAMIDDHKLLRNGLAKIINDFEGFEVVLEANNGEEFIEVLNQKIKEEPGFIPDIILLDITMPRMNGYETAAWIKSNFPTVKCLVLTMIDSDYAIIRMLNLGAKGFILKDSHPIQFHKALRQLRDFGYCTNEALSSVMTAKAFLIDSTFDTIEAPPVPKLSDKEIKFLKLVCTEMTYKQIAGEMFLSHRTVDGYRDTLFSKLRVCTRVGLVLFAIRNGIAEK